MYVTFQKKKKKSLKKSTKTRAWKLVPDPFAFAKSWAQPLLENEIFKGIYLY